MFDLKRDKTIKKKNGMMLRGLLMTLSFLAAAQGVANAQEREVTVSDVHNSGCMAYTRGEEANDSHKERWRRCVGGIAEL
jgi:hypothetical protein